jgi:DNA-binding CsgD family transcriptional regulator
MTDPVLDRTHAVDVLEAAARETAAVAEWIDAVTAASAQLLPSPLGSGAVFAEAHGAVGRVVHITRDSWVPDEVVEATEQRVSNPAIFAPFYLDSQHVCTIDDIKPNVAKPLFDDTMQCFQALLKAQDAVAFITRSAASHSLAVVSFRPRREALSPGLRMFLSRLALHIETGLRLRLDPTSLVAVLQPDGRLVHAEADARSREVRERLSAQVASIDRARLHRYRGEPAAVDAWSALVAGRFGFVERSDIQREYLVFENASRDARLRQWSAAQARAVELSALGMPGKLVAYALGVSDGEVSRLLAEAASKAGFANRSALVSLAALLKSRGPGRERAVAALDLTDSELQIVEQLRSGLSNREIADLRGTSPRTIANQVASILRKTRSPSRRALATLMI